jgi:NitT/TauT family transport system ATP-binding protein
MLELKSVSKTFRNGGGDPLRAVEDISLTIGENEFICLVGASGCGKTTTLRMVAGLEQPSQGEIFLNGRPINGPGPERSVVFQRYTLYPWRTVLDNVAFGLELQGIGKKARRKRALEYLSLVGLSDYAAAHPHQLSGGMRQRVAVARSLAADPEVLLMDEPFGALDSLTRNTLQRELTRIWEQDRKTILFITHSIREAVMLADRVAVMSSNPGRVRELININLPRPRDQHDPTFKRYQAEIHGLLL